MASSLNADDGVVSGSAGLKSSADSSGVLALQSNGTTGLTLNTSLAVGVGSGGTSYGSSGQVLISGGSSAVPTWGAVAVPSGAALTNPTITGYTETVYALGTSGSLALEPDNGTVQTCALTGDPTFTDSLSAGQSIVLMLTNGASYTVTYPTITWVTAGGNAAPTLTAADTLVFWKVSSTLYGAYVGSYE